MLQEMPSSSQKQLTGYRARGRKVRHLAMLQKVVPASSVFDYSKSQACCRVKFCLKCITHEFKYIALTKEDNSDINIDNSNQDS